jgi:hypothetical protein
LPDFGGLVTGALLRIHLRERRRLPARDRECTGKFCFFDRASAEAAIADMEVNGCEGLRAYPCRWHADGTWHVGHVPRASRTTTCDTYGEGAQNGDNTDEGAVEAEGGGAVGA